MSRLIHEFSLPVEDPEGRMYTARIRGEEVGRGHWEGWIEFVPRDGGEAVATERETTQAELDDLTYWATGLSDSYLAMALGRARSHGAARGAAPPPLEESAYDPDAIGERVEGTALTEVVLETLDPAHPRRLMAAPQLAEGAVRRLRGAGLLSNHLWSQLRDGEVTVRVAGRAVARDPHVLAEALAAEL